MKDKKWVFCVQLSYCNRNVEGRCEWTLNSWIFVLKSCEFTALRLSKGGLRLRNFTHDLNQTNLSESHVNRVCVSRPSCHSCVFEVVSNDCAAQSNL